MRFRRPVSSPTLLATLALVFVASPHVNASPTLGDLRKVGTVHLKTSCSPTAQQTIERATAMLHSFFYEEARRVFQQAAEQDPKCAMAHWGVAMTWWHPIWTAPNAEEKEAGRGAIEKAKTLGGATDVERGYIAALDAFYNAPAGTASGPIGQSCHGPTGGADHASRALAYEAAMAKLFAQRPDDVEVAAFYALGLLGTAPPTDKTLKNQTRATEILEPFYAKHPDHPGVIHYLIHGYDYPPVAEKGLPAAKAYAEIAPWVPHVLHMPSHIFTRLGMWKDVVQSNLDSAEAARQNAALNHPDATSFEELHASDYLVYGYLQMAQDGRAKDVVERAKTVRKTHPEIDFAAAYATGAVSARYALERRQWVEAADLVAQPVASWKVFPFGAAHVAFARALGAARANRLADARSALAHLEELTASMTDPRQQYFKLQAEMQTRVVRGWMAAAENKLATAEKLLREAADSDDALGKHPVSPGSLLPARELLADFLLACERPHEALVEYQASLKLNPKRLNSLYGAGHAAERSQQPDLARQYYVELSEMVAADATRPEVVHARAFVAGAAKRRAGR